MHALPGRPTRGDSLRFWINTLLTVLVPGGYGYERVLRRHRARMLAEGQPAPLPEASPWSADSAAGVRKREYGDYQEYVRHQSRKFDEIIRRMGGMGRWHLLRFRLHLHSIFGPLRRRLPPEARILCAGARQGTEVEVLRELGFRAAWGIDLNPGPDNPFVVTGDFMRLAEPDASLDLVYSNALDHAYDLRGFFREHARALKDGGYGLYEIALVPPSSFEAMQWDSPEAVVRLALESFGEVVESAVSRNGQWRTVLLARPRRGEGGS